MIKGSHVCGWRSWEHCTGSSGSSLMADRYQFWNIQQSPQESMQDWKVKVRWYGSLCEYTNQQDEMCRDIFCLISQRKVGTELFKSHHTAYNTKRIQADGATEAKSCEAAVLSKTSKLRHEQRPITKSTGKTKQNHKQRPSQKVSTVLAVTATFTLSVTNATSQTYAAK